MIAILEKALPWSEVSYLGVFGTKKGDSGALSICRIGQIKMNLYSMLNVKQLKARHCLKLAIISMHNRMLF